MKEKKERRENIWTRWILHLGSWFEKKNLHWPFICISHVKIKRWYLKEEKTKKHNNLVCGKILIIMTIAERWEWLWLAAGVCICQVCPSGCDRSCACTETAPACWNHCPASPRQGWKLTNRTIGTTHVCCHCVSAAVSELLCCNVASARKSFKKKCILVSDSHKLKMLNVLWNPLTS